ncbi:MAG: DUF2817 domain-containing protein [Gammaproteobacteria bacterium]|nr:DUF2817 domain-containing protein [Gammaproteobacteria bacterium]
MLKLSSEFDLACFSPDYQTAARRLTDTICRLPKALLQSFERRPHPLPGPDGGTLTCDVAWLGRNHKPRRLLVLMSGTHGVEGFAGSAIQNDCLPLLAEVLTQQPDLGVLLIHAFNPWGFAWLRRCDHEGIDLNRNFVNFAQTLPGNADYEALHPRLYDPACLHPEVIADLWRSTGFQHFVEVVTRGQYTHPDGCFYGGNAPSWSRRQLEEIAAAPAVSGAERIAVIDLHTGLGPYGYGELINDHLPDTAGDAWVRRWYGANARSSHLGESVSTVKDGLIDYFWHRLMGDRGCFVTLEFGTYAVDALATTLLREQHYHSVTAASGAHRDIDDPNVRVLRDFFYPEERSWQQQVLFRGRQAVSLACEGLLGD